MVEMIIIFYERVFDEDGNTKVCGREACIDLIVACSDFIYNATGIYVDYGNNKTGMMNIDNIKKLISAMTLER